MNALPIKAAREIAREYDCDQVIIVARKVGDSGIERVVTYGEGADHCEAAARAGMAIKHHLMSWPAALFDSAFRVVGVSRWVDPPKDHPGYRKVLMVTLAQEPSDNDLKMVHEFLKPPTYSPQQVEDGDDIR